MKGLICGAIGLIIGGVGGYFVAKRQFKKKLEAEISRIEETQAELYNKKVKELTPDTEEEELDGHPDILGLSEEEIANGEAEPCKPNYVDDPDDYIEEEATEEEWIDYDEKAKLEFMKKFEGYVGTSIPYPITQEQYEDDDLNSKIRLVYYPEEDKAYDDRTNEEYETFHDDIGDEQYDTLNDENCFDIAGVWYIRNDREGIDYEIEIGNRILEDKGHVGMI